MAAILSFPFRLAADSTIAVVTQGADQANAEQLGVLISTIQGERQMVPGFGIPDPAFGSLTQGVIAAQVAKWGPSVKIKAVTGVPVSPVETDVTVAFQ